MSFAEPIPKETGPGGRFRLSGRVTWPLGFTALAVALFIFYYLAMMGYLAPGVTEFSQKWLPVVSTNEAMIYVIGALGLNIVVGYAGLLDLGFVAFWAIGSYVAGWLMSGFLGERSKFSINFLGNPAPFVVGGIHLNFWMVLVIGAAFCALWGVIIGAPTLRLRSDYLALVTLGFGEIIPQVFHNGDNVGGVNISNGTKGIGPLDPVKSVSVTQQGVGFRSLGPFDTLSKYIIFVILVAFVVFMSLRLREGRLGRAWLAIREDELAASAMGVPLMRTKLAAYAMGAVAGGIAGVAYAMHINEVLPDGFDFSKSITLLAMVVLGGMGNVWGVMIGALILAWFNSTGLPQIGNTFNDTFGTNINFTSYTFLLFGITLVLMMLFRREGILPESRTRLVLREPGRTEVEALGSDMEEQAPELDTLPGGKSGDEEPPEEPGTEEAPR
jgi:branched-chain amino acid transport system permease protein